MDKDEFGSCPPYFMDCENWDQQHPPRVDEFAEGKVEFTTTACSQLQWGDCESSKNNCLWGHGTCVEARTETVWEKQNRVIQQEKMNANMVVDNPPIAMMAAVPANSTTTGATQLPRTMLNAMAIFKLTGGCSPKCRTGTSGICQKSDINDNTCFEADGGCPPGTNDCSVFLV